jgi:hypothetical protein
MNFISIESNFLSFYHTFTIYHIDNKYISFKRFRIADEVNTEFFQIREIILLSFEYMYIFQSSAWKHTDINSTIPYMSVHHVSVILIYMHSTTVEEYKHICTSMQETI